MQMHTLVSSAFNAVSRKYIFPMSNTGKPLGQASLFMGPYVRMQL